MYAYNLMIRYNGTGYKCDCLAKFSPPSSSSPFLNIIGVGQVTCFAQIQPNPKLFWRQLDAKKE